MLALFGSQFPGFWLIPASLLVILIASSAIYWALVHRWTTQRPWMDLDEWAADNGLTLASEKRATCPPALSILGQPAPRILVSLSDTNQWIVQAETPHLPNQPASQPARWNLLIYRLQTPWPTVAFQPAARKSTILDFLPLASMYAMFPGERFQLFGTQLTATKILGQSRLRALLPADVALVLHDGYLILDFSSRPFDALEMHRLHALAAQLLVHMPLK